MQIGVLPFPLGSRFRDLIESWHTAEEVGFDSLWTMDHATPTPDLTPAWEASSLLVAMTAHTQSIQIGILVFDVLLRHPFLLAGSIAVSQSITDRRLRIGLGIGDRFSRLDHESLRLPFPEMPDRVRALDACCVALPALWRGQTVTDALLGLDSAALGQVDIDPPTIIVAGANRDVIDVAVRRAQGWNLYTQDPDKFIELREIVERAETAHRRTEPLHKSVYLFVDEVEGSLPSLVTQFQAAGADEAMLVVIRPNAESIRRLARQVL
jgi:alkanesulfonate monooxygenase SsuD/methylene tetrahydromethanopterin reductase-like flavin-dependent oxidoreductase (luciferase family)